MQIIIENAVRETDANGNLVNFEFTLHLFDDSGADHTVNYRLTPAEIAVGDIDAVIARESQNGIDQLNKILNPNVIETATDYIGATIDTTTLAISKPISPLPPVKLNVTT